MTYAEGLIEFSQMTNPDLLTKVFNSEDFPSWPRKQIGTEIIKGKEIAKYSFFLDKSSAYIVQNKDISHFYTSGQHFKDCVCLDFNNSDIACW